MKFYCKGLLVCGPMLFVKTDPSLEAVFFNGSSQIEGLDFSNSVYVIYNLDKNEWNGKVRMQAIIKYILHLAVNIKRGII